MNKIDQFLWVEKYRPSSINECVLPKELKEKFKKYVKDENIPNLILSGPSGIGKTSVARAMINEIGCQFYMINASLYGNIDTLRNEIQQFSSSISMDGKRKYVILDEADYLNPNSFQPALRAFMEEFSKATGFILTCNYKSKLIEALHSRCPVIDFNVPKNEFKNVAVQIFERIQYILNSEKITYDKKILLEIIKKFFPDFRRIVGELQLYGQATGNIDSGILSNLTESRLSELINHMKNKDFTSVREWVSINSDISPTDLFKKFYEMSSGLLTNESIPVLVITLGKYQYQSALVADQDINTSACFAEIMCDVQWK